MIEIGWARSVAAVQHSAVRSIVAAVLFSGCSVEPIDDASDPNAPDPSAPAAEELVPAHDYEDLRPPVRVTWDVDGEHGGLLDADTPIVVTVANESELAREGTVIVRSYGLDDRTETLELGGFELAPGTSTVMEVPLRDLPLQAAGAPSEVTVLAIVDRGSQPALPVPTDPQWVTFEADYELASVAAELSEDAIDALLHQQVTPNGRVVTPEGIDEITAPGTAEPNAFPLPLPLPGPIPFPPPSASRICANWRVEFADPLSGQDALNGPGVLTPDASFAYARVTNNGSTIYWEGYLDAVGCTPLIDALFGSVRVDVETRLNDSPTAASSHGVRITDISGASGTLGVSSALVFLVGSGGTVNVNTTNNERRTRAAAVMSEMMTISDLRIWTVATHVRANQGCDESAGCQGGHSINLGTTSTGYDLTRSRHITGHEYGHLYQRISFGLFGGDYDGLVSSAQLCRCDHVTGFNSLHCLQSVEELGVAINEGFAHFVAAKIFNTPQQDDCRFGYYKQFLFFGVIEPPVNIDCEYPYHWMELLSCVEPNAGTELDWLTFLWDLHAGDELINFSISDLYWLFRLSCDPNHLAPHSPCGNRIPNFAMFADQAASMNAAWANRFDFAATQHGVNH